MRNQALFDFIMKKRTHDTILRGCHFQFIWQDQEWHISSNTINNDEVKKILLRYTLSHLQENLYRNDAGEFESHHSPEFYIIPPINDEIFTGDIVGYENSKYIVLNPACDLVIRNYKAYLKESELPVRNSKFFLLAKLLELNEISELENLNTSNKSRNKLDKYCKKGQYYFLPPFLDLKGYLIDFQNIKSISTEHEKEMDIIATVATSFLKDIIARFSFYYSRQGAPDLDSDHYYPLIVSNYQSTDH